MSDNPQSLFLSQEQLDRGQQAIQETNLTRVLSAIIEDIYTIRQQVLGAPGSLTNSAGGLVGSFATDQIQVTGLVAATGDMRLSYNELGAGWVKCSGFVLRCDEYPELLWVLQNRGFTPQAGYAGIQLFRVPNVEECPPPATPWIPDFEYEVGMVVSPVPQNGYIYTCVTAGTSEDGTVANRPAWSTTIGALTTDNTCEWITRKAPDWYIRT